MLRMGVIIYNPFRQLSTLRHSDEKRNLLKKGIAGQARNYAKGQARPPTFYRLSTFSGYKS